MTSLFNSKAKKSLCAGLCMSIVLSATFSGSEIKPSKLSLFFPQFTIGASIDKNKSTEKTADSDESSIEYSFKIVEWLKDLLG